MADELPKASGVSGRPLTSANCTPPSMEHARHGGRRPGTFFAINLHGVDAVKATRMLRRCVMAISRAWFICDSTTRIAPSPMRPGREAPIWTTAMPDRTPMMPSTNIISMRL